MRTSWVNSEKFAHPTILGQRAYVGSDRGWWAIWFDAKIIGKFPKICPPYYSWPTRLCRERSRDRSLPDMEGMRLLKRWSCLVCWGGPSRTTDR